MEEAGYSQALDAIYDAATAFDRWPRALERLADAFGASYVALLDRNLHTNEARATAIGLDAASQREFFDIWSERDILRLRTRTYRAGAVETDHDILPRRDLLRSDYYNGFMKPHDMHAYLRMTLAVEDECRRIISFARPVSLGEYDTVELEHCRRLMPHFQRAARVMRRVEESNLVLTAFSDLLEQSSTGVLLLSRTGKVLFANRAARAMAQSADGFLLRGERIEVVNRQHHAALQRLIAGAAGRADRPDGAARRISPWSPHRSPTGRLGARAGRSRSSWSPIPKPRRCARKARSGSCSA
jgi:PAS domain-containing protein